MPDGTTRPGPAVLGIDNVLFAVGDLPRAIAFYRDTLGLTLGFTVEEAGLALFALGPEAPGLLLRADRSGAAGGGRVWLEVPDARTAAAGVDGAGTPFRVATGWTVEISDPWGNVVGFTDYTAMPERGRAAR